MKLASDFSSKWIFYLVAGCFYLAVILRSMLYFRGEEELLSGIFFLLSVGLVLTAIEPIVSPRWKAYFPIYLLAQVILIYMLLLLSEYKDFFAVLFFLPSMLIMLRMSPRMGWLWIGFCALLTIVVLWRDIGAEAIALTLVYSAGNVFFGSYALTTQRAQAARLQNQALAQELQAANQQIRAYSTQLGELAVARERNQWARELHDSVTQTVFSMSLTTQSAALLLERDPVQAQAQLERLSQLAQAALAEMQLLISELRPEKEAPEGLLPSGGLSLALREHLENRRQQDGLKVSLEVEGDQSLEAVEETGLFRIAQEALNNILKHAHTDQAQVKLHLAEPYWMEVADQGEGFVLQQATGGGKVGLHSMRERAAAMGWDLQIITAPGAGTRVRVEKAPGREKGA
jgi:signal transduction histidine kinase